MRGISRSSVSRRWRKWRRRRRKFSRPRRGLRRRKRRCTASRPKPPRHSRTWSAPKRSSRATTGAISRQEFDAAQALADAAQAALQAARSALQSAEAAAAAAAGAGARSPRRIVKEAELQLSYTEILAPAAGRIGKKNLETGNRVQPGQALLALVQPDVWVAANFKETQLARLKPGQPVRLRVDAFPGRIFTGQVESLAPASGAQFALLPPDNATGNFTKIVQRVPVKIAFDSQSTGDCEGRIVPGMSAVVQIKVRE